ncbi:MAG: hypothetical protein QM697_07505 [Lachnospiraceae bacterium]
MNRQDNWKRFETTGRIEAYLNYRNEHPYMDAGTYYQAVNCRRAGDISGERFCLSDRNDFGDRACQ